MKLGKKSGLVCHARCRSKEQQEAPVTVAKMPPMAVCVARLCGGGQVVLSVKSRAGRGGRAVEWPVRGLGAQERKKPGGGLRACSMCEKKNRPFQKAL